MSFVIICSLFSCLNGQPIQEVIYQNNFEEKSLFENQSNLKINTLPQFIDRFNQFNGSTVFGNHGTGSIILTFDSLTTHDYMDIEFDLYIHDQWEGNGLRGNGEDVFILNLDQSTIYFSSIINTRCLDRQCESRQSFPEIISRTQHYENANVENPNLFGWCSWSKEIGGSKKIHIKELYPHNGSSARIQIGADIKDTGQDLCFKSWSIDNLKISTLAIPDL